MQDEDSERVKYGQFVELLNAIRRKKLISAKKRRDLDQRWRSDPEHRDLVLEEIEGIIERHNEEVIPESLDEGST
ncbi:MAG: hypothetical protein ACLFVP_00840 [Candidatus Bathyarchaeia archaeon]